MEVVDDGNTGRISYEGNWAVTNTTGAGGGTVHSSTDPEGVISLTFVGTSIEIDAKKSPTGANFSVVLDGSTYGPYSLYAPTASVGNVWSQSQLNPTATHTIALQKVQQSAGPDSVLELNVDAFRIAAAVNSSSSATVTAVSTTSHTVSRTSTSSPPQEPTSISSSLSSVLNLSVTSSLTTSPRPPSIPEPTPTPSSSSSADGGPDDIPPTNDSPSPSSTPPGRGVPTDIPSTPIDSPSTPTSSPITSIDDFTDPPNLQPATSQTSQSSSTRSSSSSSSSNSSTSSTSHITTHTTIIPVPISLSSTVPEASSASSTAESSQPDNRVGVILGSIVAVIIFLCLITIPVVYLRRRHAAKHEQDLRASTTPAYQTRTTKGLLMPLGVYRRSTSAFTNTLNQVRPWSPRSARKAASPISPTSPAIRHHFGFGSQRTATNTESSHTGLSPSPLSPVGGASAERPTSFEGPEGRSHYVLYPDAPGIAGVGANGGEFTRHRHGHTDSISSDYPYPLTYNAPTAL